MGSKKYRNPEKREAKAQAKANSKFETIERAPVPTNTFWDDARALYEKSIWAVEYTHGHLSNYLKVLLANPQAYEKMNGNPELISNINLLTRDIGEHTERLKGIYAQHADKSGGSQTPDEHMAVIRIHGLYHDAVEIYESTIMPTVAHIFEQIGVIDEFLEAQKTQAELTQPQVTDVEAVETVNIKEESAEHV